MYAQRLRQPDGASVFSEGAYDSLLDEARQVSDKTMGRLRALQEHFPEALSAEQVERLERLRHHDRQDRRRGPRRPVPGLQVETRPADTFGPTAPGRLVDHSQFGVGIWLMQPEAIGTQLYLWGGEEGRDVKPSLVEVRRCEATDRGWLLGCEMLSEPLRL